MTDDDKTLVKRLRIRPLNMLVNPASMCSEAADRIEAQAAEIGRISSQRDAYLDGYKKAFADVVKLHDALQEARGSLYQCFRSSRDDALESHPDWAEHIADIHFEAATALAKIEAALEQSR
jgi:hypothetical protein